MTDDDVTIDDAGRCVLTDARRVRLVYGDWDRNPVATMSPEMIFIAERL